MAKKNIMEAPTFPIMELDHIFLVSEMTLCGFAFDAEESEEKEYMQNFRMEKKLFGTNCFECLKKLKELRKIKK